MQVLFELLHMQLDLMDAQQPKTAPEPAGTLHASDSSIKQRFVGIDAKLKALCQQQQQQHTASVPADAVSSITGGVAPGFLSYATLHVSLLQVRGLAKSRCAQNECCSRSRNRRLLLNQGLSNMRPEA